MREVSRLADALRPFWLAGLNDVAGRCQKELRGWLNDERFQVYTVPNENSFTLSVSDPLPLLEAYAAEINRISTASSETMASILITPTSRKSAGWLIIQTYYAAFFAAHSLLRLLGTSCTPLEPVQIRSVTRIADLFGQAPISPIGGGLYQITYDPTTKELRALQLRSMKAGPHEAFWKVFCEKIDSVSRGILNSSSLTAATAQSSAGKLSEMLSNLRFNGSRNGAWLSTVRNRVNYDHSWATWYPYSQRHSYYDDLARHVADWDRDPLEIDLTSHQNRDLLRFQATCNAIMALSKSTAEDMAQRCTVGKSFHDYGFLAFNRLYGAHRRVG
jgi:hypothetical protein